MRRFAPTAFVIMLSLTGAACSSSTQGLQAGVAPATTSPGVSVEPVDLSHLSGPAGESPPMSTTVVPTTEVIANVAPVTEFVEPVPETLASTIPVPILTVALPTQPIPTQPPAPKTVVVVEKVYIPAPTVAPTRAVTTRKPVPVTNPPESTLQPAPTAAPTPTAAPAPTTRKVRYVKVGGVCKKAQLGVQQGSSAEAVAVCQKVGKSYKWVAVVATTTPNTPLLAGAPAVASGFDGRTFSIGMIGTTSNPTWSNISKAITAGFEARIATINRRGGIAGKYPVKLVVRDANYDAGLTVSEIAATKDQVIGYGSILGTPSTEAALSILRDNQLLASPASQEARWAKEQNLLPIFNSYQVQAANAVAFYNEQVPGATVCAVSIASSFGDAGTEGFTAAATDLGLKVGVVATMAPTDNNPAPVLAQLARSGCQGIMATVSPVQLLNLVVGAARSNLNFRWISMGAGFSDRIVTQATSKIFEASVWVVGDGPVWGDQTQTLANELLASDNRFWTENPDVGLTFGYTQAKVWEAILENAVAAGDVSRGAMFAAAKRVGRVETNGFGSPIDYSQAQRLSAPRASIFAVDGSYRNSLRMLAYNYQSPAAAKYQVR
jgi:ABC-type branched-subunit amino acid transport system substrate-binding protein